MPLALSQQSDIHLGRLDTALYALPVQLSAPAHPRSRRQAILIELHNRFAYPAACLVLMLVGVPLGVASRRGGKSSGFVFTILLVFVYYFLSSHRHRARPTKPASGFSGGVVGQPALCRRRHLPALANGHRRPHPGRHHQRGSPAFLSSRPAAKPNGFPLSGLLDRFQPRAPRSSLAASSRASSTSTSFASFSPCSSWSCRALSCS